MHHLYQAQSALPHLPPSIEAIVIVDVLSFTTCVDIALSRGARVFPYRWKDHTAEVYAKKKEASLARRRESAGDGFSLSPSSMLTLSDTQSIVLPSPNGSHITMLAKELGKPVYAACLRNSEAVATHLNQQYQEVAVIAGMEKWPDRGIRFAVEDWLGAAAVLAGLEGEKSSAAKAAIASFHAMAAHLPQVLTESFSGQELIQRGYPEDVHLSAELNSSQTIPRFEGEQDCYVAFES